MTPYNTALQALGVAGSAGLSLDEAGAQFEMLFLTSAYTADLTNAGHDFENDLTGISHREVLSGHSWTNRVFTVSDKTVTDPNNGQTVTQMVLVKSGNGSGGRGGGGTAATNRVIAHQTLSSAVAWDGTNDNLDINGSGIFRIGA